MTSSPIESKLYLNLTSVCHVILADQCWYKTLGIGLGMRLAMIIGSSRMIRCQDYTVEPLHKVTLEIRASFESGHHVASMAQV